MWIGSLGREDPLEEEMAIHFSILPEKSHGQRSLVDYSPKGCKELNMIEWRHLHTHYKTKIPWKKVHLFLRQHIRSGLRREKLFLILGNPKCLVGQIMCKNGLAAQSARCACLFLCGLAALPNKGHSPFSLSPVLIASLGHRKCARESDLPWLCCLRGRGSYTWGRCPNQGLQLSFSFWASVPFILCIYSFVNSFSKHAEGQLCFVYTK